MAAPTPAAEEGIDHPTVIYSQAAPRTVGRLQFHSGPAQGLNSKTPTPQEVVVKFQNVGGGFLSIKEDGYLVIDNTSHKLQCVTFRRRVRVCDERPVISLQSEQYPTKWITGHTTNYTVDGKPDHSSHPSSSSHWLQVSYSALFPGSSVGENWQVLQYWGTDREQNIYFTIRYDQSSHLQFHLSSSLDEVKKHGAFVIDSPAGTAY